MQIDTTRQPSYSSIATVSAAVLSTWLMALAACGLILGAGLIAVSYGQSGEEEFQRKMDELKRRGKQQRQPGEERTQSPASSGTETSQMPGGVRNRNIGAIAGTCQQQYDRFRNTTSFDMVVGTIYKTNSASAQIATRSSGTSAGKEELRLALAATTSGRQAASTPPQQVEWYFQSTAPSYRYHDEAEALMIIDGERVKVGQAYAIGGTPIMGEVLERLRLRVPAELFARIIKGRGVEVKIGTNEFPLSSDALKALRAFATCTGLK